MLTSAPALLKNMRWKPLALQVMKLNHKSYTIILIIDYLNDALLCFILSSIQIYSCILGKIVSEIISLRFVLIGLIEIKPVRTFQSSEVIIPVFYSAERQPQIIFSSQGQTNILHKLINFSLISCEDLYSTVQYNLRKEETKMFEFSV